MSVYDQARVLAKALNESPEYKALKQQKTAIESDPKLKKMFTDYRSKQFEMHKLQVLGQKVPEEQLQALRKMHEIVVGNSTLKKFLEAEQRFGTMMADIQKIIVEGLELN